jgi:hypothetical protein
VNAQPASLELIMYFTDLWPEYEPMVSDTLRSALLKRKVDSLVHKEGESLFGVYQLRATGNTIHEAAIKLLLELESMAMDGEIEGSLSPLAGVGVLQISTTPTYLVTSAVLLGEKTLEGYIQKSQGTEVV